MDFAALRRELTDLEDRLRKRVSRIERDLRRPHDADSQERATERLNEPVLEALDEHVRGEIEAPRAAAYRIDEGVFGRCAARGKSIDEARLAALPTTTHCLDCAA